MSPRWFLITFYLLTITATFNFAAGQRFKSVEQAEDTILTAVKASLTRDLTDSSRNVINQLIYNGLHEALRLPASDDYPFESLKSIVTITSPDKKFRIFHWNLPGSDGKQRYFGFIKMLGQDPPVIFPLTDISDTLLSPDTVVLDNAHWYGSLYYKIIPGELSSGKKIYTLLGWAGRNSLITQKVIEVLMFDDHDKPRFGLKVFPDFKDGNMARIIFRYSAETTMSMKYEKQSIATNKRWNSKKREFDYSLEESLMIVCDRVVPIDPQLTGQYQYYVAAGDIFDGFLFRNNCWTFLSGIDTRNKK